MKFTIGIIGVAVLAMSIPTTTFGQSVVMEPLNAALEKLQKVEQFALAGSVTDKDQSDISGQSNIGMPRQFIVGQQDDYRGGVELMRVDGDDILVRSTEQTHPKFEHYDGIAGTLTTITFAENSVAVKKLAAELSAMTNWRRLKRSVAASKDVTVVSSDDGGKIYKMSLPARLINANNNPMDVLNNKVNSMAGKIKLNAKGDLTFVAFTVSRANGIANLLSGQNGTHGVARVVVNGKSVDSVDGLPKEVRDAINSAKGKGASGGTQDKVTLYRLEAAKPSKELLDAFKRLSSAANAE